MTHTAKVHAAFWRSMSERFGNRWFEVHGKLPSDTWVGLLNQFDLEDIEAAQLRLKDRPERERAHPPTHAEFQALLVAAQRARGADGEAGVRNRWRSITIATCMRNAALLNLAPWGETKLEKLPDNVHRLVMGVCQELVTWACDTESREGQRTAAMEQHINSTLWNLLKPWARTGEHNISHLSANAPRGTSHNTEVQT